MKSPLSSHHPADAAANCAGLDRELAEVAAGLSARDRRKLSLLYFKWAQQLEQSLPQKHRPVPRKIPKGFILINLSVWQQKRLRELSRLTGCPPRNVLRWALAHALEDLEARALIERRTGLDISRQFEFFAHPNGRN